MAPKEALRIRNSDVKPAVESFSRFQLIVRHPEDCSLVSSECDGSRVISKGTRQEGKSWLVSV